MSPEPESHRELAALRASLDSIDVRLLDILRSRIDCCVAIGALKSRADIPMMQPHRIGIVQQRAADYAAEHDLNGEFLRSLYELIIAETCRVEDIVMASSVPAGSTTDNPATTA